MSTEYWIVSEAVPYFTKRLAQAARPHPVNAFNGARMFQLLFAVGWEPTRTHYTEIPDGIWNNYQNKALSFKVPEITFELLPLQTRLPDKRSIPAEPEDSVIPVRFFLGADKYMIPFICNGTDARFSGKYFLNLSWDHDCEDGPFLDKDGNTCQDPNEGAAFCIALLGGLDREEEYADFDDALREFLFDKVSGHAHKAAADSMYRAWEPYLLDLESMDLMEERFREAAEDAIYRTPGINRATAEEARRELEFLIENYYDDIRGNTEIQQNLLGMFAKTVRCLVEKLPAEFPAAAPGMSV